MPMPMDATCTKWLSVQWSSGYDFCLTLRLFTCSQVHRRSPVRSWIEPFCNIDTIFLLGSRSCAVTCLTVQCGTVLSYEFATGIRNGSLYTFDRSVLIFSAFSLDFDAFLWNS